MDETVNSVINNIAEKLGIAVEYVVPALVKYNIANCIISLIWGIVSLIIIYISIKTIFNIFKKYDDDADFDDIKINDWILVGICCILIIIFVIVVIPSFLNGLNIIKWIMAPEGAAIAYILQSLK